MQCSDTVWCSHELAVHYSKSSEEADGGYQDITNCHVDDEEALTPGKSDLAESQGEDNGAGEENTEQSYN